MGILLQILPGVRTTFDMNYEYMPLRKSIFILLVLIWSSSFYLSCNSNTTQIISMKEIDFLNKNVDLLVSQYGKPQSYHILIDYKNKNEKYKYYCYPIKNNKIRVFKIYGNKIIESYTSNIIEDIIPTEKIIDNKQNEIYKRYGKPICEDYTDWFEEGEKFTLMYKLGDGFDWSELKFYTSHDYQCFFIKNGIVTGTYIFHVTVP